LPQQRDRFAPAAAGIFAVAFVVRLVHVWQIRAAPFFSVLMGDSRGYDEWARRIAGGDWIGHDVFYQAPLYPYFLGVIFAVAGRHLLLVRIIQIAIGSASCVLLALAGRRLFSSAAGIAAGLVLALYAPAIFFDGLLQKSVLDVFFVCLALWIVARITTINAEVAKDAKRSVTLRSSRSLRFSSWAGLGLAMGGLALTRENALVFIGVIAMWGLVVARVRLVAAFVLGLAIVLVPVAARNAFVGGGFYVTTSQLGPNFYIGNNPTADGTYASLRYGRGAPEYERQDATELAELAAGRRLSPAEVSSYWTDRALQFITSQPGVWLQLLVRKFALLWNRAEMVDTEDQATHAEWSAPLRLLGPITHFGVLVPLAVFGIIVTWPKRSHLWVLYLMLVAYAASVVLFYVFARYRYPLVPLLVLFAAAGIAEIPILLKRFSDVRSGAPSTAPQKAGR
jgi:4-amino-4-deoxy-L-arabinose transferase-like glycosyltransferase